MKLNDLPEQIDTDRLWELAVRYRDHGSEPAIHEILEGMCRRVYVWLYGRIKTSDADECINQAIAEVYIQLPKAILACSDGLGLMKYLRSVVKNRHIDYCRYSRGISRVQAEAKDTIDHGYWVYERSVVLKELIEDLNVNDFERQIIYMLDADYTKADIVRWIVANQNIGRTLAYRKIQTSLIKLGKQLKTKYKKDDAHA